MATLPSRKDLGMATVSPSMGVVGYRGDSGQEGVPGKVMQQAGAEIGKVGDRMGEIFEKAREEQAKTEAQDALNQYQEKLNTLAYDEKGWTTVKGGAANIEFSKKTEESFGAARDQIESSLTDPMSKKWFKLHSQPVTLRSSSALLQHVSKEQTAYRSSVFEKSIALKMDSINNSFGNDEMFQGVLMEMASSTREYTKSLGLPDDAAKAAVNDIVDKAQKHRIKAAMNADDIERATELYKQAKNGVMLGAEAVSISTAAREEIDTMLKPAIRGNKEMKVSNATWDQFGPKGRSDPIEMERMMDAVRQKHPNESATFFSNTRTMLQQRAADRDTDIQKADGKAYGVLQEAMSSGKSISELQKMPEWVTVTPAHHAALQEKATEKVYQDQQRRYAAEDRLASQADREANRRDRAANREDRELNREFNRIKMKNDRLEFEGSGVTNKLLDNSEQLMALSDEEITNMELVIGQSNVKLLRAEKNRLKNPINVSMDKDMFTQLASAAGFEPTKGGKGTADARLLSLKVAAQKAVDKAVAANGNRRLSPEKESAAIQQVIDNTVMRKDVFSFETVPAATVLPDEFSKITVPVGKITPEFKKDTIKQLKTMGVIPAELLNDQAIMDEYGGLIARLYAARQAGATDQQIKQILGR